MNLRNRLQRLEKQVDELARSEPDVGRFSDDDRAMMVRAILARFGKKAAFPRLGGSQYLEKFRTWWPGLCPWVNRYFPEWAWKALCRISGLTAADMVAQVRRWLQKVGQPDPFPKLTDQAYLDQVREHYPSQNRLSPLVPNLSEDAYLSDDTPCSDPP